MTAYSSRILTWRPMMSASRVLLEGMISTFSWVALKRMSVCPRLTVHPELKYASRTRTPLTKVPLVERLPLSSPSMSR